MRMQLPRREQFIRTWNLKRRFKDGFFFQKIQNKYSTKKSLALLFASYWVDNPNFYILDILDDNYKKYKRTLNELENLKELLTVDFESIKDRVENSKSKSYADLLRDPKIMTVKDISYNSLSIFDKVFKIHKHLEEHKKNNDWNIVYEEKWAFYNVFFKKYFKIIMHSFDIKEVKQQMKEIIC
jgi:hypothetical protein